MNRHIHNSRNLVHLQHLRTVGGFSQPQQFAEELARSEATVRALKPLFDLRGHLGCVNVIVFSPSGDMLASGSDDGKVRLWNPYTFKCLRTMNAHQSNVFAAEFLPFNEQHLVSGGNDAELKYYNLETDEGTVYSHHTRKVLRMTVHVDHPNSFMSCSADGTVRMIDTRQHYEASVTGPIDIVQGREGEVVPQALGGGRGFRRTANAQNAVPATASLLLNYRTRNHTPQLFSVDFNPMNGNQFIVSSDAGDIRLFDLRQIREHSPCSYVNIFTHEVANMGDITGCAFSKDGRTIVATALNDAIYTFDANRNFEVENQFPLCLKRSSQTHACDSSLHKYSHEMIARVHRWKPGRDNRSTLYSTYGEDSSDEADDYDDEDTSELISRYLASDDEQESNEASEEPTVEPSGDNEQEVNQMNTEEAIEEGEGEEAAEEDENADASVPSLRDLLGAWPAVPGDDGVVTIDLETFLRLAATQQRNRRQQQRQEPESAPRPATTSSRRSRWTREATEEGEANEGETDPHPKPRRKKSPYGPSGASSSSTKPKEEDSDSRASKSNTDTEEEEVVLPQLHKMKFVGHASQQTIKGVGFWGPRSEFVVSGSDDANTFIWDTETGKLLNVLQGHDDVVNCVVGHPRIPVLATSGIDDIIKLWDPSGPAPDPAEVEARVQTVISHNSSENRRMRHGIQCAQQ